MSGSFAVIISIRYCLLQCWMRVGQQSSGVNIDETAIVMPAVLGDQDTIIWRLIPSSQGWDAKHMVSGRP